MKKLSTLLAFALALVVYSVAFASADPDKAACAKMAKMDKATMTAEDKHMMKECKEHNKM